MRSLNWKLSGALLLIVLIAVALMAYLTNLNTASEFRHMMMGRGYMGGQMMAAPEITEEDVLDQVNDSLWKAGLITAGVALVIGLVLTRQITRPVKALITGARRLSKGELSYRVKTRSNDEIGELADSFNSMAATLEQAEQSRRQLTADIAHELRTPLTIIEGTVEGILDDVFEADSEHLNSIKEQTLLLTHLINDLRDISLAESGQLTLNLQPTDIVDLVKRVVTGFEPNAGEKNIRLDLSVSVESLEMEVDPVRMEQVISNLLGNAIRHTPEGGSITVAISREDDKLELSVSDTGEGITPEDLPHVFERFYRSGTSRSRKEGGTGLGLAIVKQMVEAHGGTVTVESTPGKGSTFLISLPLPKE